MRPDWTDYMVSTGCAWVWTKDKCAPWSAKVPSKVGTSIESGDAEDIYIGIL